MIVISRQSVNHKVIFFFKWAIRFVFGVLALLMLAMLTAYLIPLETYLPGLEQTLSERLKGPVRIRHLRIAALPLPHLELQNVQLGGEEGIVARSVMVEPDLMALLAGVAEVRRIRVQDGSASLAEVRRLADLFGTPSSAASAVALREFHLSGMSLQTPALTLGPFEARLNFAPTGKIERVWLAMDEQKLTIVLLPLPERRFGLSLRAHAWNLPKLPRFRKFSQLLLEDLQVEGELGPQDLVAQKFILALRGISATGAGKVEFAEGWKVRVALAQMDVQLDALMKLLELPLELKGAVFLNGTLGAKASTMAELKENVQFEGDVLIRHAAARIAASFPHPLQFDHIKAHVAVQDKQLKLEALEVKLYGGKLKGSLSVDQKAALLVAKLAANDIAMQPLVAAFSKELLFTGNMEGAAKFSVNLAASVPFPNKLQLAGDFHLRNGQLAKVDLLKAASNSSKASGGQTRFDDLTGQLAVDMGGYHFRKLKILSGSLNAEGRLDVSPALQLAGSLEAEIKGTAGLVSMPLVVSGTLNEPLIRPSGSAMAGAAVGTAVLGPGLGTAVGIKVGGYLQKLFGKSESDNKQATPKQLPAK